MPSGVPGRMSQNNLQRKALMGQDRQAEALERIAAALEFLVDHMYPRPAESVIVDAAGDPAEPAPMENEDESGTTPEV